MRKSTLKMMLIPALLSGAVLTTPFLVAAQDSPPPPPPGEQGPGGHHHGHHRPGGPFMHELHDLGLSDTQKASVKSILETDRASHRAEFEQMRSVHRAYETLVPGSAGYATALVQLQDAEATAARNRVQHESDIKTQVFAVLTDAQKQTLATKLANLPEPPAPTAR